MSLLTLQFGQCGNQIGQSLYSILEEDISIQSNAKSPLYPQSLNKWFNINSKNTWEPRSIIIDTETKVAKNLPKSSFEFKNVVAKSLGGSANNWAYGYTENSKSVISEVLNVVRSALEKSDFVMSFLNLYSLSGGTGSGVGSYIIEKLRTDYPKKTIVNCAVLPYVKGEISTQAYNCLLSLTKLYSVSDATIIFENERLLHLCKYSLGLNEVAYSNINSLISQQVASVFQPVNGMNSSSLIHHLTAHPSYKLLQIRTEPNFQKANSAFESVHQWNALVNALMKPSRFDIQQANNAKCGFTNKVVSSALLTRGMDAVPSNIVKVFRDLKDFVTWLPQEESVKMYTEATPFLNYQKFFTHIFNSNNILVPINTIVEDAWTSFIHGAYLHHYSKYGVVIEPYGWTEDDKKNLMAALKRHGEMDFDALQRELPHKSMYDIRNITEYYKGRALGKYGDISDTTLDEVKKWMDIIRNIGGYERGYIDDLIPRALKYIALFEKKAEKSDINLSDAYTFLSGVCSGEATRELSERTGYFLYQCLVRLAEHLQKDNSNEAKAYLNQLEDVKGLSDEFAINPLNVPENLLELTRAETDIDIFQSREPK